jgi:hypothetical protein
MAVAEIPAPRILLPIPTPFSVAWELEAVVPGALIEFMMFP